MATPDLGAGLTDALSSILNGLVGQLESVTDAFRAITGPVEKFVEALSPGTMQVFQGAIRDLNATIGVGLLPVIQVFTDVMHQAAGILLPVMQKLQPIVTQISQVLGGLMLSSVNLLAQRLTDMLPTLQSLVGIFDALAGGAKVLMVILSTFAEVIGKGIASLFGGEGVGGIGKVLNAFRSAIYGVVRALTLAAGIILNTFGGQGALKTLIDNLNKAANPGERAGHGAGGALANAGLKGLEQFQKDLAVAASQAVAGGGGGGVKEDLELFKRMATALEDIQKNDVTLKTWFINEAVPAIRTQIGFVVTEGVVKPVLRGMTLIAKAIEKINPLG